MSAMQCDPAQCLEGAAVHWAQGWGGKGAGLLALLHPYPAPCYLLTGRRLSFLSYESKATRKIGQSHNVFMLKCLLQFPGIYVSFTWCADAVLKLVKCRVSNMLWFLLQCEKLVDPDIGIEGQPACDLRAVGKKFDKGLYTTLVSKPLIQCLNTWVLQLIHFSQSVVFHPMHLIRHSDMREH